MLKIACIDDEKEFRDTISLFIEKYSKEYNLEYHIDYYENGLSFIFDKRNFYNLLFIFSFCLFFFMCFLSKL